MREIFIHKPIWNLKQFKAQGEATGLALSPMIQKNIQAPKLMTIAAAFAIDPWVWHTDTSRQLAVATQLPVDLQTHGAVSRVHLSYPSLCHPLHCFSAGSLVDQRGNNLSLPCPSVSQSLEMDRPLQSGLTHIHISVLFPLHCEPVFSRGRIMNVK